MNISELKSVIHEVLNEMNPAHLDAKVTEIKKEVEKLFNENETYVDHEDIENIILSHIKDVSQAESIFEEIVDFADKVAKEQNYISLGSDKYVKKEGSLDEVKRKKLVSLIKESIEESGRAVAHKLEKHLSMLGTIATVIGEEGANIDHVEFANRSSDFRDIVIDLQVHDLKHLTGIIALLKTKSVVSKVERVNG